MRARVLPFASRSRMACGCTWPYRHTVACLWAYIDHASSEIPGLPPDDIARMEAFREMVENEGVLPVARPKPHEVRP